MDKKELTVPELENDRPGRMAEETEEWLGKLEECLGKLLGSSKGHLYLLTQEIFAGNFTYDSCVVCARSEEEARTLNPSELDPDGGKFIEEWPEKPEYVTARYLGVASAEYQPGTLICASYNAG